MLFSKLFDLYSFNRIRAYTEIVFKIFYLGTHGHGDVTHIMIQHYH